MRLGIAKCGVPGDETWGWSLSNAVDIGEFSGVKVKLCPRCDQEFSATAAGLELLYLHLLQTHEETHEGADELMEQAVTEERVEPVPRDLPRCH